MTDIVEYTKRQKKELVNPVRVPGGRMMKAVSEISRAHWWEWAIVGVLFVMAVVCAHA